MKVNPFLSAVLCVSLIACVDAADDPTPPTTVPKLAGNSLDQNTLWLTVPLVSGALTSTNLQTMAANANKRVTLGYAIKCALSSSQSVSVTVSGSLYTFPGELGLATSWTTTALTTQQIRSVSACLATRTNYWVTPVTVSLRGEGLVVDGTETYAYGVDEGAFWGDLFAASPWASACMGRDQALNDTYGDLPNRECAEPGFYPGFPTPCNFNYAGLCASACTTKSETAGYSGCSDGIHASTNDVMTSYLYGHL